MHLLAVEVSGGNRSLLLREIRAGIRQFRSRTVLRRISSASCCLHCQSD